MEKDLFKKPALEESTDPIAVAACNATNTVNELQEQLTEAKRLKGLLDSLTAFKERSLPLHVKALCEKEKDFLKALREKHHPAISPIEELYREMNTRSGNAIREIGQMHLVGAQALSLHGIAPQREFTFLQRAQLDHEDVLSAILAGESARAESLMREHARRSRDNKRILLAAALKLDR